MKFLQVSAVLLALAGSYAVESAADCREKEEVCQQRVQVNVSSAVSGLVADVPKEVFEAFVVASAGCLKCVDKSNVQTLVSVNNGCNSNKCKGCGEAYETWLTCRVCCGECRCMGCPENYGPDDRGARQCDSCCTFSRKLSDEEPAVRQDVDFNINVCVADVTPLNPSASHYLDYAQMLTDFESELQECYADSEGFLDSWSSLCADSGIDLSLMARTEEGGSPKLLFGMQGVDSAGARVTTYSSDESHRSTSHMIFYSALGFVAVSAFAVFGTAVVVRVINKRKEEEQEQSAKWVSEMATVDTANPLSPSDSGESSS